MNKVLLSLIAFIISTEMDAQLSEKKIPGEYYLTGVMEVGSGFQLLEDHTFSFFFTYGALDRFGKGTWKLEGEEVVLNSEPWPGSDFVLSKQERRNQHEVTVRVTDANELILGYIECIISGDGKKQESSTEKDGTATFKKQQIDTIQLFHRYFSDAISVFRIENEDNNYFEFTLQPYLGTVYFNDFRLSVSDGDLTGSHPIMREDRLYTYEKSK